MRLIDNHSPEAILSYIGTPKYVQRIGTQAHLALNDGHSNLQAENAIEQDALLEGKLDRNDQLAAGDRQMLPGPPGPPEINDVFAFQIKSRYEI